MKGPQERLKLLKQEKKGHGGLGAAVTAGHRGLFVWAPPSTWDSNEKSKIFKDTVEKPDS